MANFNPAFSNTADKRFPTSDERQNGFACGPADRELFNGLIHRVEAEIGNVITAAGITPADDNLAQLLEAINAIISAATGGNPAGYILMTQARARLPIFPEVLTADGKLVVTTPVTGTVRVPAGVLVQHRGIFQFTTASTDFATVASKTYHLRWNPTDGFTLNDIANTVGYNPGSLVETHPNFDSGYDDMLVARVITNASNIATITNLINKDRMYFDFDNTYSTGGVQVSDGTVRFENLPIDYNFARVPKIKNIYSVVGATSTAGNTGIDGNANRTAVVSMSRYRSVITSSSDMRIGASGFYARVTANLGA